jgi:hypothetical protein
MGDAMADNLSEQRIIARCGLICSECPAFLATKADDADKIAETAAMWSKMYGADIPPESVWCDGCTLPGRKCAHCAECDVRDCASDRDMDNCGLCADMPGCDTIQNFFKMAPQAKEVIMSIAAGKDKS